MVNFRYNEVQRYGGPNLHCFKIQVTESARVVDQLPASAPKRLSGKTRTEDASWARHDSGTRCRQDGRGTEHDSGGSILVECAQAGRGGEVILDSRSQCL